MVQPPLAEPFDAQTLRYTDGSAKSVPSGPKNRENRVATLWKRCKRWWQKIAAQQQEANDRRTAFVLRTNLAVH